MSFFDQQFGHRGRNLYFPEQAPSGPSAVDSVQLNGTFASMLFAAQYQAAFPISVAIGPGVFDGGTAGDFVSLNSPSNTVTNFSGVGSVLNVNSFADPPGFAKIFEYVLLGNASGNLGLGAFDTNASYDRNGAVGGRPPPFSASCYCRTDGTFVAFTGTPAIPVINVGDAVGMVHETSGAVTVFINGVVVLSSFSAFLGNAQGMVTRLA